MDVEARKRSFSEIHLQKTKQFILEVLTVLVLGLLLNILASIIFLWVYNPPVQWCPTQIVFIFSIILLTLFSVVGMVKIRMPKNIFRKTARCYLLWDVKYKRLLESIYDHPEYYSPQQFSWQVYETIEESNPELFKGLGPEPIEKASPIIADMFEYLIFLWLGLSALEPTYRFRLKEKTIGLEKISGWLEKNRIIQQIKQLGKKGWTPPDINIVIPEDVSISVQKSLSTNNEGEFILSNKYFSLKLRFHKPVIRSLSSMHMGPVPSILGMPLNPFFLEKERKPGRHFNFSSIRTAIVQIFFEVELEPYMFYRYNTFYKYMQWAEQISNSFMRFFDWRSNIEIAVNHQKEEIYRTLKLIETRINLLEKRFQKEN